MAGPRHTGAMTHDAHGLGHPPAGTGPEYWDERYGSRDQIWSGRPNEALVAEVAGAGPGTALDVGCGEGADAIWLAQQGWQVTGLDPSAVALERAERAAAGAGVEVAWVHGGLEDAALTTGFDLVSAHYPALLRTPAHDAERALLATVAPGGTLLVVHHAHVDPERAHAHGWDPADFVASEDVLAALDDAWVVEVNAERPRIVPAGPEGQHTHDLVVRARRVR